jgi:hypothetical protein
VIKFYFLITQSEESERIKYILRSFHYFEINAITDRTLAILFFSAKRELTTTINTF